jgi:hypothetical protein
MKAHDSLLKAFTFKTILNHGVMNTHRSESALQLPSQTSLVFVTRLKPAFSIVYLRVEEFYNRSFRYGWVKLTIGGLSRTVGALIFWHGFGSF